MFAEIMQHMMHEYEEGTAPRKKALFAHITAGSTVLDIGIGVGPNLPYMPKGVRVIGLEPNRHMWGYSEKRAEELGIELSMLDGTAEEMPLADASIDHVICTLTLCSVESSERVLTEIGRVLRPGGTFSFIEHVLAGEDEPELRREQYEAEKEHRAMYDGCSPVQDTGAIVEQFSHDTGVFKILQLERFDAAFIGILRPHILGIAQHKKNEA